MRSGFRQFDYTKTDNNGYYRYDQIRTSWTGNAAPTKNGFVFQPAFRKYYNSRTNKSVQSYEGSLPVINLPLANKKYRIKSALGNFYLDVQGGVGAARTNVWLWSDQINPAQEWIFESQTPNTNVTFSNLEKKALVDLGAKKEQEIN